MSQQRVTRVVTVSNPQGLHARPAFLFAQLAGKYSSTIEIVKGAERVDGKSILSILTLAVEQGTPLSLEAIGDDAEAALDALANLIQRDFPGPEDSGRTTAIEKSAGENR
jgi:phosphotransferase system HPr (HPr) family protein